MTTKMLSKSQIPSQKTTPISGEELSAMGDIGPTELVEGEIIHTSPTGHPHGYYEINIAAILFAFVRQLKLGRVLGGKVGIYTKRDPDTVRAADVAFISNERLAQVQSKSYLDVAPELIVEVLSPDDSWSNINQKLEEYFAIGVDLIWVVDPRRRQIHAYRSLTHVQRFAIDDEISADDILPGFTASVAELFGED